MVSVPNDLRKNKEKILGNMDLRQTMCVFLACILAIGILYYFIIYLKAKNLLIVVFFAGLSTIPFLVFGFKRINGMKIEEYLKVYFNNKVLANEKRSFINRFNEKVVKNRKNVIIRFYKIKSKDILKKARDFLILKGNLILTEYISYNNGNYILFRLDGTNLIKEAIKNERSIRAKNGKKKSKISDIRDSIDILNDFKDKEGIELIDSSELISQVKQDERNVYILHLFNKEVISDYIKNNACDKIVFIDSNNKVNVFIFGDNDLKIDALKNMVDLREIDKKNIFYQNLVSDKCINNYNYYRSIDNFEDML